MSDDEQKYDIPDFSHIEDRVERARAKAAAVRKAKEEVGREKTISEDDSTSSQHEPKVEQSSQTENTVAVSEAPSKSRLPTILVVLVIVVTALYFVLS